MIKFLAFAEISSGQRDILKFTGGSLDNSMENKPEGGGALFAGIPLPHSPVKEDACPSEGVPQVVAPAGDTQRGGGVVTKGSLKSLVDERQGTR